MFRKCLPLSLVSVMIFTLSACAPAAEPVSPAEEGERGIIPDPDLEAVIREALDKPAGELYPSDLEQITSLTARGREMPAEPIYAAYVGMPRYSRLITDLTGLEYCINLTGLWLSGNGVTDLSPLANLTNLERLEIEYNQISDISPLASLTKLTSLKLGYNKITDLSPLASLTNLEVLNLDGNQITDLSPLASLTKLTKLWLSANQISDISPLAGLTGIWQLRLPRNNISDISPLLENSEFAPYSIVVADNPLSEESLEVYIPQLQDRGVDVRFGIIEE